MPNAVTAAHYLDFQELLNLIQTSQNDYDVKKITKAYEFANIAHGDQRRLSGVPYILHPTSVACILVNLGMDTDSVIAALLHDIVEDTPVTLEEVRKLYGKDAAFLIDGVTKLSKIQYQNREEAQAENLRKMLMAMFQDIRVIIIKLADRLHNMRTLDCMREQKRLDISRETMEVFAPIAYRLGMKSVKDELEDIAIKYLDPVGCEEIQNYLDSTGKDRDKYIESVKQKILRKTAGIIDRVEIQGRVKSICSIYRKTYMKGLSVYDIFDVFAVRIIVDNITECFTALGVVHDLFRPMPNRFKDYISTPKPNMYQSLHTTVFDKDGIPFEVQIRTWDMHYAAEYGIAAHWKYKLGLKDGKQRTLDESLKDIRTKIQNQIDTEDSTEIVKNLKNDFEQSNVYVFTPGGDIKILPKGSTVIDYAYSIHSGVGNRMVGAKVDGSIVPFDYKIKTSQIIEILTQKTENPNRNWLQIVKTSEARSKIKAWFKKERREENIIEGKAQLEAMLKRNGMAIAEEERQEFFGFYMQRNNCKTIDDFYAAIGYGGISLVKLTQPLRDKYHQMYQAAAAEAKPITDAATVRRHKVGSGVIVEGMDDCLVKFSKCCNPLPGDKVIGFITRGHGVSVHNQNCTNVPADVEYCEEPERWVNVTWVGDEVKESFNSTLEILAGDRTGFIADVSLILTNMHIFIHSMNSREIENNQAQIVVNIEVTGRDHLKAIMAKLGSVNGVTSIRRL
ncbi:MAG: bifunctional (p)ppGpp synthetase/guanosine-3',5'-bis(diphosphate) 3'-pyrophosphohydrolase [Oscillospiraceae bacterium]|nr:bifunctional (p)ppGpp synthetase/guanosine-3',5'-bis(diphosphate) 3'-pyrophosphohydrolase [Oscillospiraceae bacterium]